MSSATGPKNAQDVLTCEPCTPNEVQYGVKSHQIGCGICLEDYGSTRTAPDGVVCEDEDEHEDEDGDVDVVKPFKLPRCGHSFCTDCLHDYVRFNLVEDRLAVPCPFPGCGRPMAPNTLRAIVPEDDVRTHVSLSTLVSARESAPHVDCAKCGESVLVEGDASRKAVCEACGTHVCGVHGRALPCRVCKEDGARVQRSYMRFAQLNHIKRCPTCARPIEKYAGCDQMRCPCGARFRWTSVETEFPCPCVHLTTRGGHGGGKSLWGSVCKNHTCDAQLKLISWRAFLVFIVAPMAAPLAVAGGAVAGVGVAGYMGVAAVSKWHRERHSRALRRGALEARAKRHATRATDGAAGMVSWRSTHASGNNETAVNTRLDELSSRVEALRRARLEAQHFQ